MQQVVQGGTGTKAQLDGGRPTAGKTGTTSNSKNAWFTGFTPQLSTSVMITMSKGGTISFPGITGGVYGGQIPAEIFKAYMDKALSGAPVLPFPPRANVGTSATPSSSATTTGTPSATPSTTPTLTVSLPPVLPSSSPSSSASPSAAPPSPTPSDTPPPPTQDPSPAASP